MHLNKVSFYVFCDIATDDESPLRFGGKLAVDVIL